MPRRSLRRQEPPFKTFASERQRVAGNDLSGCGGKLLDETPSAQGTSDEWRLSETTAAKCSQGLATSTACPGSLAARSASAALHRLSNKQHCAPSTGTRRHASPPPHVSLSNHTQPRPQTINLLSTPAQEKPLPNTSQFQRNLIEFFASAKNGVLANRLLPTTSYISRRRGNTPKRQQLQYGASRIWSLYPCMCRMHWYAAPIRSSLRSPPSWKAMAEQIRLRWPTAAQ